MTDLCNLYFISSPPLIFACLFYISFIVFTLSQVFLSLSFGEDLRRQEKAANEDNRVKNKKNKKRKNLEEPSQMPGSDKKKSRKELMTKMREEVFLYP